MIRLWQQLRAWDVDSGKVLHNDKKAHEQFVSCVAVAPTTRYIHEFWLATGASRCGRLW